METVLEKDVNLDLNGLVKYYCLFTPKFTLNEICSLINKHHQHNVTKRRVKYSADQINNKRRGRIDLTYILKSFFKNGGKKGGRLFHR